jgi:glycosyltransferase involved in cell wall biosynthesis
LHGIAQGLDQILAAAARLEDVEELAIALVGDGPEKEALIAQAQAQNLKNVRFIAPQPRERMPSLLASADIALVPLKQRLPGAVPSKLYEAMGASLPVVLVAEGEAAQIVHESQAGIVVRPGDIEGLTSALRQLVENPSQRRQMGARGREAAVARFDCQAIADAFIDFLEERL